MKWKNNFWMCSTTYLSLRFSMERMQKWKFHKEVCLFAVKKDLNYFLLLYGKCTVKFWCDVLQRSSSCKTPAYFFFIKSTCHKVSSNLHFMGSLTRHIVLNSSRTNGKSFFINLFPTSAQFPSQIFSLSPSERDVSRCRMDTLSNYNTLIRLGIGFANQVINCATSSN